MPWGDGTGPWWGTGPGTGWGFGPCGAGLRMRRRFWRRIFGRGYRRWWGVHPFFYNITPQEEKELLKDELTMLQEEIKEIETRLKELEGKE